MSNICFSEATSFRATRPSFGISDDAKRLEIQEQAIRQDMFSTNALSSYVLQDEMLDLYSNHSIDNWDGYGAKAVTYEAVAAAFSFLFMLPIPMATPELSVDPDGRVVFEWYRKPFRVFSVAVEEDRQLIYSGLFDTSKASGVEYFGNTLPEDIIRYVDRVFS